MDNIKRREHGHINQETNKTKSFNKSWTRALYTMNKPENASSLAAFRILFYFLMVLDIPYERSFAYVDYAYGSKSDPCHFPLFDFLPRPTVTTVSLVYIMMLTGAIGSLLGLVYRLSTIIFCCAYWFIFIQDKTLWNNHSYLYGLIGTMFCFFDAESKWSVDGFLKNYKNRRVPQWNYLLLRSQIFLVYFLAGLKKTEMDWLQGYSCSDIAHHWVFAPFRLFFTTDYISLCVVHMSGFLIDLLVGFLLLCNSTRLFATLVVSCFHLMNSQIFSIGMFPFVMLSSTLLFYNNDWPLLVRDWFFGKRECFDVEKTINPNCIYDKHDFKNEDCENSENLTTIRFRHKVFAVGTMGYLLLQLFLPYSHFITQGYNSWTNGLYGYSWDMMVHSWHTQHIKITCVDLQSNHTFYVKPDTYTSTSRWSSHADMIKQHALCISKHLVQQRKHKKSSKQSRKPERRYAVYMDIWRSMNNRFEQRLVRPDVNLVTAPWNPFKPTNWTIPLYANLSNWRPKMKIIREKLEKADNTIQVTFVADTPGLHLTNYIEPDISAVLTVLDGELIVEDPRTGINVTLNSKSHPFVLISDDFHNVYITSTYPACYYYSYRNTTLAHISKLHDRFVESEASMSFFLNQTGMWQMYPIYSYKPYLENNTNMEDLFNLLFNQTENQDLTAYTKESNEVKLNLSTIGLSEKVIKDGLIAMINDTIYRKMNEENKTIMDSVKAISKSVRIFFEQKALVYKRSIYVIAYTFECIVSGNSLEETLLERYDIAD